MNQKTMDKVINAMHVYQEREFFKHRTATDHAINKIKGQGLRHAKQFNFNRLL